jgi:cytoskeletal protein RodZ
MNKPEKTDPQLEKTEKLDEIGSFLRETRQQIGVSLETISQKTRIPLRLLRAIEEANIADLPEDVYIRAFIKQIADYLGLNGDELSSRFPLHNNLAPRKRYFAISLPSFQLRPFHLYFLYILLVMVSVRAIAHIVQPTNNLQVIRIETDSQPTTTTSPSPTETVNQTQPPTTAPNPTPPAQPPAEKPQSVSVEIKIEDKSWLRVVVDGKTEFEGIVTKGTQKTWVANQQLTIRAGNAGGVLVSYNEQEAKQLGKLGQVEEVTYTANKKKEPSS